MIAKPNSPQRPFRAATRFCTAAPVLCILTSLCTPFGLTGAHVPSADPKPKRMLIICVDGVGHNVIEKMRAKGRFAAFREPARMIAPFPAITNIAIADILRPAGAPLSPGYEDRYFEVETNHLRGSVADRFTGSEYVSGAIREYFDYHPSSIKTTLGYAAPPLSTYLEVMTDIARLRQKFQGSKEPVFFAYIESTDLLAHLGGERMLRSALERLDDAIADIVRNSPGEVEVVLLSDHGNEFRKLKRAAVKDALRKAGFQLGGKLKDNRSAVFPQYGLVSSGVVFTTAGHEARAAEAVSSAKGVDFAAYLVSETVVVISRNGRATVERKGDFFRYAAAAGDPLDLLATAERLARQGRATADGFIADSDWFAATVNSKRPDAIRRLYDAASNHVRNRASVIISFEDGYYTGSMTLDVFAFLLATHGSISGEQSFGVLMSTSRNLPAHVRAASVWKAIGSPVLTFQRRAEERSAAAAARR